MKLKKAHKYMIFNLSKDSTTIITEKKSEEQDYDTFLADLPEAECRWAIYDFEFEKDGGIRKKLCFFMWTPDDAKTKNKMLFASSKEALKRALVGVPVEIQATDYEEVSYQSVLEKASKGF